MGQKHSKKSKKKSKSLPEITEIVELNDSNHTTTAAGGGDDVDDGNFDLLRSSDIVVGSNNCGATSSDNNDHVKQHSYPSAMIKVMENVALIEKNLNEMSSDEIDLYFATIKDQLYNDWQKVYEVDVDTNNLIVKQRKIELIEQIKFDLNRLNNMVLMRKA